MYKHHCEICWMCIDIYRKRCANKFPISIRQVNKINDTASSMKKRSLEDNCYKDLFEKNNDCLLLNGTIKEECRFALEHLMLREKNR